MINLADGGTYHASRTQRWLWERWLDFCDYAKRITEGYRRIGIFNGDLMELDILRRSTQLITVNKATILAMTAELLEPLVDFTDKNYFVKGTAAHAGKSAWSEEAIAADTINTVPMSKGVYSWWQIVRTVEGVKVDIAHHASAGKKAHTRQNSANNLAFEIANYYLVDLGQPAPDLALRAHNHYYATSADNHKVWVDFLPSWAARNEYSYRINLEHMPNKFGSMIYLCEDGKFTRHPYIFEAKENRRIWNIKL